MKTKLDQSPRFRPHPLALALALAFLALGEARALPGGEQVVAGQVSVARPGQGNMVIQQGSNAAIVNWQGFSIGAGESVRIQQPSASSAILNRVVGNERSDIDGRLTANGKVFLVNPNGVLFGPSAAVDVGSLVASTLSIGNEDFLAGRYLFNGSGGRVVNAGSINVAERGTAALLGGSVRNDGTITARLGTVVLAAGERMTLDLAGDGLSQLTITQGSLDALVANGNAIVADGGQVLLSAQAVGEVAANVINQSGVVRARSLVERQGRIVLDGGDAGLTTVTGSLDATGRETGTRGGEIQVLGHHLGVGGSATLDASGNAGGGEVLVGGDFQGKNPAVRNARITYVGPDATLRADAGEAGDGGKVIVWSDEVTRVHGTLSARGGASGGNGGLIETSGRDIDTDGVRVSAAAPAGAAGLWLVDPENILIGAGEATAISATLSGGTSVTVETSPEGEGGGDITVGEGVRIEHSGPAAVALTLSAHRDISINDGAAILATGAGPLAVDLNADRASDVAEPGIGRIAISGAVVATNGGTLRMYGQTDPENGFARGWNNDGDTLPGVSIVGTQIRVGSGNVRIRGASNWDDGVRIDRSTIGAALGSVHVEGKGSGNQIVSHGVNVVDAVISGAGGVVIRGDSAFDDDGVKLERSAVASANGRVSIVGTSSQAYGVYILDNTTVEGGGGVDVRGRSQGDSGIRLDINSVLRSGAAPLRLVGDTASEESSALDLGDATLGGEGQRGDIVLRARNAGDVDSIRLYSAGDAIRPASIRTAGALVLVPGGLAAESGGIVKADGVPIGVGTNAGTGFEVDSIDLSAIRPETGSVIFGSETHTGRITLAGNLNFTSNLSLQNEGEGSAGIGLGSLDVSGRTLTLATRGPLDQFAGGRIVADRLLVRAGSATRVSLTNANSVNRLAVDPPASFSFVNAGPLVVGQVSGTGFSTATGEVQLLTAANSSSFGDFFVQTLAGPLTLAQNITTLDERSNITLVAGSVFTNAGGSLTPGAGGRWRIWADTWVGETRGGLAGTTPYPNFYGCAFGADGCASGATVPQDGNRFIYAQRPTLALVADDKARAYGLANPPLTYSYSGLVNGDTLGDALSASVVPGTSAVPSSPSGAYPINLGVFPSGESERVSAVGYNLSLTPGTLKVFPPPADPDPNDELRQTNDPTYLYDRNLGLPTMCIATGPLMGVMATQGRDILSLEWSRVRQRPNLSNCVDVEERNGCGDF